MKILLIGIAAIAAFIGMYFVYHQPTVPKVQPMLGGFAPTGGSTYRLGQSVGTTDSTIKLSSFKEPVSNIPYTMSYLNSNIEYGTLSPQSSFSEFISFSGITQNGDGSATLTGVVRGLTRTPAGSNCIASTTLAQPHAGQSIFIISNSPCFYSEYTPLRTNATSSGILVFSSTSPPRLDYTAAQRTGTYIATTSEFVTWDGLNAVVIAGASNATVAVKGIVQLPTARQAASSTALGSTGASNVLPASMATDTPTVGGCSITSGLLGGCVAISDLGGHLKQAWLDLTQGFNFIAATSTSFGISGYFNWNGLGYTINGSRQASSTVLSENGAGALSWNAINTARFLGATTTSSVITSTVDSVSLGTIPANLMKTNGILRVDILFRAKASSGSAGPTFALKFGATTVCSLSVGSVLNTSDSTGMMEFLISNNNSSAAQTGFTTVNIGQGAASPTNADWESQGCTASVDTTSSQVVKVNIAPGANDTVTTIGIYTNFLGSN